MNFKTLKSHLTLLNISDALFGIWFLTFLISLAISSRRMAHCGLFILLACGIISIVRMVLFWREAKEILKTTRKE